MEYLRMVTSTTHQGTGNKRKLAGCAMVSVYDCDGHKIVVEESNEEQETIFVLT